MSAAFTPGRWSPFMMNPSAMCVTQNRLGFRAAVIELSAGDITAEARGKTAEQCEANARLIAAAPELYDALVIARGEIARVHQLRSALPQIDAALAKARGEQ